MFDKLKEECGVFGIYDVDGHGAARTTYYALFALQHRGQESCGIAVNDNRDIFVQKDIGLVPDVFTEPVLNRLTGHMAIGHCRYSTTGNPTRENAQPLVTKYVKGTLALAHNGNLTNSNKLRRELEHSGAIFQSTNDTEVITYVIAKERLHTKTVEEAIENAMDHLEGAYSLVIMSPQKLIAARDPDGFRPLCMGKLENSYVFASESCAIDAIGATFIRDIDPGEVVVVDEKGPRSLRRHCGKKPSICIFEYVYFARPDSVIEGASVHQARQEAGKYLAIEHPVEADIVVGVPDSGLDAALGYAKQSGIPYGIGFIKNRYIGRTFIQPTQGQRETSVRIKLNPLASAVKGKRVVMVDDSIVRGTTSKRIVNSLREAGAKEIHMRVSSPPFLNPCYFGTDIDSRDKLIANNHSLQEIRRHLGVESLGYLSIENLRKIPVGAKCHFCEGCFTGKYPIDVDEDDQSKNIFE
ncbi:amidophosphoribosyltransferase [Feifania hominis]|uniref:Amidophosphoribosyltransferase n=1 Tax=Feifania hominis TaxID=2763660 RepID=A0A926DFD0_9FIRM|nr:amidophosphoribosyltransferase [Feifania hominis]MBC8536784.1 amidophosphoribosyltransferase [Feifania hominis]